MKEGKLKKTKSKPRARSDPVKTWEQLVKEQKPMLVQAWNTKDPQKSFSSKIRKLHKKYTNGLKK